MEQSDFEGVKNVWCGWNTEGQQSVAKMRPACPSRPRPNLPGPDPALEAFGCWELMWPLSVLPPVMGSGSGHLDLLLPSLPDPGPIPVTLSSISALPTRDGGWGDG